MLYSSRLHTSHARIFTDESTFRKVRHRSPERLLQRTWYLLHTLLRLSFGKLDKTDEALDAVDTGQMRRAGRDGNGSRTLHQCLKNLPNASRLPSNDGSGRQQLRRCLAEGFCTSTPVRRLIRTGSHSTISSPGNLRSPYNCRSSPEFSLWVLQFM